MRTSIWDDFKLYVLRSGNTLNHLIAINLAVFVLFGVAWVIFALFTLNPAPYEKVKYIFSFPAYPMEFVWRPWSIVTYQFMHAGVLHIVFNMLVFWFAGRIFREFLGDKKLLATYILGGSVGALFFMLAYSLFPLFSNSTSILVGASASIMAVLAGIGTLLPNYHVRLILFGDVKLIYVVLVLLVIDLLSLAGSNAGGSFAHIGGMIWGFAYIKGLQRGVDLGGWFVTMTEKINTAFSKKPNLRKVHYNENMSYKRQTPASKKTNVISQEEVDLILDKIAQSGYDSLSDREKDILFRASKDAND